MIRAITSFKSNNTNTIFSNKCCGTSQPNFKGKEQEYVDAFAKYLEEKPEISGIQRVFLEFAGEAAMKGKNVARAFVDKVRNKVPGVTEEQIAKEIDEGWNLHLELL